MSPVDGAQFSHRRLHMFVDGPLRDVQDLADFPSRFAVRDPAENLAFARRQFGLDGLSSAQPRSPVGSDVVRFLKMDADKQTDPGICSASHNLCGKFRYGITVIFTGAIVVRRNDRLKSLEEFYLTREPSGNRKYEQARAKRNLRYLRPEVSATWWLRSLTLPSRPRTGAFRPGPGLTIQCGSTGLSAGSIGQRSRSPDQ